MTKIIFLIDDDPDELQLLEKAMEAAGKKSVFMYASDWENAFPMLSKLHNESGNPCLILLDVNMPGTNGKDVLKSLKTDQSLQKIPVLIYSTSTSPKERQRCLALGADDYLTKPVTKSDWTTTVETLSRLCN